jgi:SPP1 gp7 family putative phage head morphogenesis protein
MTKPLAKCPLYRAFVTDRDRALEHILNNYLTANSRVMDMLIDQVMSVIGDAHSGHGNDVAEFYMSRPRVQLKLDFLFDIAARHTVDLIRRLRVSTYTLAHAGEVEAIARALGKPQKVFLDQKTLDKAIRAESPSGGLIQAKISFFYNRLKHRVFTAMEQAVVLGDGVMDAKDRVRQVFPKPYTVRRPKRELKVVPFREADDPDWLKKAKADFEQDRNAEGWFQKYQEDLTDGGDLSVGIIDDHAWRQVVDDYRAENIPFGRGVMDFTDDEGERRYDWEIEKELTQDFVEQVRSGQVDAAQDNGINDFMWIAVIDDKTDDCCAWRDGLTTSEIEEQLKSGHSDDDCDATVPPAHFNCRCTLAPVTKDFPEETPPDFGSFEDWLNS